METARRASVSAWNGFVDCEHTLLVSITLTNHHLCLAFFLTAHFSDDDYPYDW